MPTSFLPGDVILVRFPFTALSATKLRPAVVLATHGADLVIVGIFSIRPHASRPTWIALSDPDPAFPQTGLKVSSVIKPERIAVIEQSVVVRKLGSLSPSQLDQLKSALR